MSYKTHVEYDVLRNQLMTKKAELSKYYKFFNELNIDATKPLNEIIKNFNEKYMEK